MDYDNQEGNRLENWFHSKRVRLWKACKTIERITGIPAANIRNWIFEQLTSDKNQKTKG